jgi:TolB protein
MSSSERRIPFATRLFLFLSPLPRGSRRGFFLGGRCFTPKHLTLSSAPRLRFLFALLLASTPCPASEPVRLTHDGARKLTPAFAPGGEEVVYASHELPNLVALMRLKLKDGTRDRVLPDIANHQFDPALSPDGRRLAYGRATGSPQMELVIRDLRQSSEVVFRPRDTRATARQPSLAPDGSRVAFSLTDVGGPQVASVDAKGQDLRILSASAGASGWPAYSPDGSRIAFASSRDGDFEIYVMDADGSSVRRLTHSPGRDLRPSWSPDGSRVAFTATRDGDEEVYVMDADGSNTRNISRHPSRDTDPAWHPDGLRLAIVSDRDGGSDLYLIGVD